LGDIVSGYFLWGITMNTDYAKEKLAAYQAARDTQTATGADTITFEGFTGAAAYAFAAGTFATLTRFLVEELDRLQARTGE